MIETITYGPWVRKSGALPNDGAPSFLDGLAGLMATRRVIAHVTATDVFLRVSGPALTLAALANVQAAYDAWEPT